MTVQARRTVSSDPEFTALAGSLTLMLAELNGEKDAFYSQHNKSESLTGAVVAIVDGVAVGCGGFRSVSSDAVEIKRMFVDFSCRGRGIGSMMLEELEKWSSELGHKIAILETSKRLASAVGLYRNSGYEMIANYGPYVGVEDSICMQKSIGVTRRRDQA